MRTNGQSQLSRKEQIISCFIEHVATLPYEEVTITSIASYLEISKGVMTYHYPRKQQLLRAAVETILGNYTDYLERVGASAQPANVEAQLRLYVRSVVGYMLEHPFELQALQIAAQHLKAEDGAPLAEYYHQAAAHNLQAILLAGCQSGEFRDHNIAMMAELMLGCLDGMLRQVARGDQATEHNVADVESAIVRMVKQNS